MNANKFVIISGCSGGGKSTLLEALAQRGYTVVREPGRRIIAAERARGGSALPWNDPSAFAAAALVMAINDYDSADGLTFFDRGVVDAAVAVRAAGDDVTAAEEAVARCRYGCLLLAPPWPEIYASDADRQHSLAQALTDYEQAATAYAAAGYAPVMLPHAPLSARADFVLAQVDQRPTEL